MPRSVPAFTGFCGSIAISDKDQGFYFQPLFSTDIFCSQKGADGVTRQIRQQDAHAIMLRAQGVPAAPRNRQ